MTELTDYLYDLIQNSITANPKTIQLEIYFNDLLEITLTDDGFGMDEETLRKVRNFEYTSRTKRKVGLGLSMIHDLITQTNGYMLLESEKGIGTKLKLGFDYHHMDFPKLGNIGEMVSDIYIQDRNYNFILKYNEHVFDLEALGFSKTNIYFSKKQTLKHYINRAIREVNNENTR